MLHLGPGVLDVSDPRMGIWYSKELNDSRVKRGPLRGRGRSLIY